MDKNTEPKGTLKKSTFVKFNEDFWVAFLLCFASVFPISAALWVLTSLFIFPTTTKILIIISYSAWLYYDRNTPYIGGSRCDAIYNNVHISSLKNYFPIRLHKTAELPADGSNYLLVQVPHGVLALASLSCFTTRAHNLAGLFPNITFYPTTLPIVFFTPFLRELARVLGAVSVSPRSFQWTLKGPNKATTLYPGGATESSLNGPGQYRTVIKRRKGYCRLALSNGSNLVPIVIFGEVDSYEIFLPEPGSLFDTVHKWVKKKTRVSFFRFTGRGLFGLLPRRRPIDVVVGAPINVEKKTDPTEEDVDALHAIFISKLTQLFDEHKAKYLANPETELEFV